MRNPCRQSSVPQVIRTLFSAAIFLATAVVAFAQAPLKITSGEDLPVPGKPVAADHGQLSEHNIEWMQTQPPQVEAEFLLSAAINHDRGATDWIEKAG